MDIDLSGSPDLTTIHAAVVKLVQGHQDQERRILESERVRSELLEVAIRAAGGHARARLRLRQRAERGAARGGDVEEEDGAARWR